MAWHGIWFESLASEGGPRSPERLKGLAGPTVYPYVHGFIEAEEKRLKRAADPGSILLEGEVWSVYYSINHDGSQSGLEQQGCRILNWLFRSFNPSARGGLAARFSEIPVVIHTDHPAQAAALGNALTILRFLNASEDQAIAKILLHPWNYLRGSPRLAAEDYEKRVIDFLNGEVFYPDDVTLFDVLERNDLKPHRDLGPCCLTQIGFIAPLLEWIDECWPRTDEERKDLFVKLRNSLADEAKFLSRRPSSRRDA